MHFFKAFAPALLAVSLLASCEKTTTPPAAPVTSTIKVSVSEAGAPPYDLNEARVVSSNYQTGATTLIISGKISNGKSLMLNFEGGGADHSTGRFEATLDGTTGTQPIGSTTYNSQARTVTGSFRSTFPSVGEVSGSFSGVAVQ